MTRVSRAPFENFLIALEENFREEKAKQTNEDAPQENAPDQTKIKGNDLILGRGRREVNTFFKLMLEAKEAQRRYFVHKGSLYVGSPHPALGMIYKRQGQVDADGEDQ